MSDQKNPIDVPGQPASPFLRGVPVAPTNYQKPLMKLVHQMQHPKQTKISKNWKKKHTYY